MDRRPDRGPRGRQRGARGEGSIGENEERNDDGNADDASPPKNHRSNRHGKSAQDESESGSESKDDDHASGGCNDPGEEKREEKEAEQRRGQDSQEISGVEWLWQNDSRRQRRRSCTQAAEDDRLERAQNETINAGNNRNESEIPAMRSSQRQRNSREKQATEKSKVTENKEKGEKQQTPGGKEKRAKGPVKSGGNLITGRQTRRHSQDSGIQRLQEPQTAKMQRKAGRNAEPLLARQRATRTKEIACDENHVHTSGSVTMMTQDKNTREQQMYNLRPDATANKSREQRAQTRGQQNGQANVTSTQTSPSIVPLYPQNYTRSGLRQPIHITPRSKNRTAGQMEQEIHVGRQETRSEEIRSQVLELGTSTRTTDHCYRNLTNSQTGPAKETDDFPESKNGPDDVRRSDPSEDHLDDDSLEGSESHLREAGTPGEIPAQGQNLNVTDEAAMIPVDQEQVMGRAAQEEEETPTEVTA